LFLSSSLVTLAKGKGGFVFEKREKKTETKLKMEAMECSDEEGLDVVPMIISDEENLRLTDELRLSENTRLNSLRWTGESRGEMVFLVERKTCVEI
jgi:hypothetical protein